MRLLVQAATCARLLLFVRDITRAGQGNFELFGFVISDFERIGSHDSIDWLLGDFDSLQSKRIEPLPWAVRLLQNVSA